MELHAHRSYSELDYAINFWRTKSGLEVDFEERLIGKVRVIPWKTFLTRLWAGEYLK